MYNGPQDVSENVDGMSGIKFALGFSGIGHTNIKDLNFNSFINEYTKYQNN